MSSTARPTLWHIPVSHYNEKARWALDYKGIEYEGRETLPGVHMALALWLTRGHGYTFPLLVLDAKGIGDSTAIIAALEERQPEPPLYPEDPAERERALKLEDWFDTELGPYIRRFVFHELRKDRERFQQFAAEGAPDWALRFPAVGLAYGRAFTALRFGAGSGRAAAGARDKVLVALDKLESELGVNEYLVGDRFTVADLTAASLLYPVVLPPEGPIAMDPPESFRRFQESQRGRRAFGWVEEMFRRHRRKPAAPTSRSSGVSSAAPARGAMTMR